MAEQSPNVLPIFDPPRKMSYRAAVAKIVRDLKSREGLSNVKLADKLDCSDETISNAENEHSDLSAVTLCRIAYVFGEDAIQPVRDLYQRRYRKPRSVFERLDDALAELEAVRHELAERGVAA